MPGQKNIVINEISITENRVIEQRKMRRMGLFIRSGKPARHDGVLVGDFLTLFIFGRSVLRPYETGGMLPDPYGEESMLFIKKSTNHYTK
jgi:hypothetical protein